MEEIKNKLDEISLLLKTKENDAYKYFDNLSFMMDRDPAEAIKLILTSYSIIQYANLDYESELLFDQIWNLANNSKR
ncbi:hypothetical protein [Dysgonomonas sp. 520]|uniref:hypothetical protein n=1 Tax=Dysgonomonas sp. 520 TaxID=2302931 RepID=UPI0013D2A417|nr:hypothetical protein [Dysgonomonas sp. 520]NDW11227.1 hypothetical protein [Dysgonomonas sp. 520]